MSTRNEQHVHDLSTLANFKDWASAIGAALAAFGWIQSNDTGQVVWTATVLTLTAVTSGGVYSYSSFTGPAPRVGMSVIFTGFATGGNNVTATLTAVSGGASGTVTVAVTTQANETHAGSGTTTAQSSVPTSGNYVYEIWSPGDGGTAFYVRFDYGNSGGSSPSIKVAAGTGTNGSGTINGFTIAPQTLGATANSGAPTFNCLFAGSTNWFAMMMWRDLAAVGNLFVAFERSHDTAGADTNTYFTSFILGSGGISQQSVVFGVGAALQYAPTSGGKLFAIVNLGTLSNSAVSQTFNGNTPVSPAFPLVGYLDNPAMVVGTLSSVDFTEGSVITTTIYSATHTYVFSKNQTLSPGVGAGYAMRWE